MNFKNAYENFRDYSLNLHKEQSFKSLMVDFELRILPIFKDFDIFLITKKDILNWKNDILSRRYSNSYNDRLYYVFSIFLDYCCSYYDLEENLLRSVGCFKPKVEVKNRNFYTLKEFRRFIKNVDNIIYKSYFTIMFFTGCRPSECMALKFSDFDGKYIHITKSIQRRGKRKLDTPKNKYSIRDIVLNRKSRKCIKKLGKYYKKIYGYLNFDYFILGGPKPLAPTTIDRYKAIACKKANLKQITQHQFRHSYATNLLSNGVPLNVVSKMLGHSNVETTAKVYTQQDSTQEKRVLRTLNSHLFLLGFRL